ncbi:hypothetical protein PHMEG_00024335 [Phytophthora megakarya]|uniref:M96 mating-specific protein n=1 Tax=Phytophthora megakarya TaxID=4795 RepID=A0A225VEX8_9STRA|nr:hypothetical protein PHMEG_00024335 [Phytophthora megakarya]
MLSNHQHARFKEKLILNLRLKAEKTNVSIQNVLQLYKNEIRNMKRRFKRRIDEEYVDLAMWRMPTLVCSQDRTRIFADLLRDIDELYIGVDTTFQMKTMETVPCPGQSCQVYPDIANGVFVEFFDKSIVPFSAHKACEAVWKSFESRGNRKAHVIEEKYSHTGNTATTYLQYVCKVFDTTTHIEEHRVVRKYVHDSQTVFVSRIASKPVGDCGNLNYRETVCLVVKSGMPLVSGQETAIIDVDRSVARFDDDSSTAKKFRTRRFTSFAVQGWKKKISFKKQEVENLLFEGA